MTDNPIIWQPGEERRERSAMCRFMKQQQKNDYDSLHRWSIEQPGAFWHALADFCGVEFSKPASEVLR